MLTVSNPATGKMIKQLVADSKESLIGKFESCQRAQKQWALKPLSERIAVIDRFKKLLMENADSCAEATSLETGRPVHQVANEIRANEARIQFFLDNVERVSTTLDAYKDNHVEERISWDPLGVVANISAWNYPYFVGTNVFVPALLTGNGVMYKASEFAALTGEKIAELMAQAGVPDGVFSNVVGDGSIGQSLLDLDIQGVFFTGSYKTGKKINEYVAPRLLKVGMELGGKDPCFVTENVEVDSVAAAVADGAFYNCGQSCCAVERVYVHESIYDEFLKHFIKAVEGLKVGDPSDSSTYLGPLTRNEQRSVLSDQISDAVSKGATLQLGGNPIEGDGYYFEPTVLSEVNHSMSLMKDESFGPIIGIQKVSNDQEAIDLMNDTEYGLTASVYCNDEDRSKNIMFHLNAGTVYRNCCDRVSPYTPWSGRGHSGIGSTLSDIGISTFVKPKAWHLK